MRHRVRRIGRAAGFVCVVSAVWFGAAEPASAQVEPAPSSIKVDASIGAWISTGDTRWSHNASAVSPLGNPTSSLTYTDHTANVTELTIKVSTRSHWFGRLNVGYADIGGGRLTDAGRTALDRFAEVVRPWRT